MRKSTVAVLLIAGIVVLWNLFADLLPFGPGRSAPRDMGAVDWSAIAAWPPLSEGAEVESVPDPDRTVTVIVLDDSSSMSRDFEAAKRAVLQSLDMMGDGDRVALLALNAGLILPPTPAREAGAALAERLRPMAPNGSTPLGPAVAAARDLLATEAARARGFGTYRIIVTTDGVADQPELLAAEVATTVNTTPIAVATIGIGIGTDHVLNAQGHTSYVAVDDVSRLDAALQAAIAENTRFDPIQSFE
jgi:hypothetical protein